ncbi:MAG: phosphatidate cytidylyltransferase [Gemmatimonadota bacterium]
MSDSNLVRRVGFAVVAIPIALGVVWYGGWPLVALVSLVSALGARELLDFAHRQDVRPSRTFALGTAALLAPIAYVVVSNSDAAAGVARWAALAVAVWLIALLTWALARRPANQRPLAAVAITVVAVLYTGALPAFLLLIRHGAAPLRSWPGTWLVFFPLVVTWVCDTAAMFGGRAMGGPKLAPSVSPGKTRSGSLAGVVGGIVVAVIFALWVFPAVGIAAPMGQLIGMAAVLSVMGQVGDLAESLFKREVGVKDSSALIPGHGGVLDRFDSLYFVIPLAAVMYRLIGLV